MLSMAQIGGGRGRAILATVLLVFGAAGCGSAGSGAGSPAGAPAAVPAASQGAALGNGGEQPADGGGSDDQDGNPIDRPGLLIIKTGTLTIQVDAIDPAVAQASQKVSVLGGYVAGSERSGDGDTDRASIIFRVPAASWDQALVDLRALATKIINEHTSTQDVTSQVVDLGARIRNLQATEQAVQAIMERATDIDDVLTVQAELTRIRGEIEQLAAQKSNFEGQAAFSTLTVTFSLKPEPVIAAQEQFDAGAEVGEASASLVGMLQGLATAGIWFAIVWLPILLAITVLALVGLLAYRRAMRVRGDGGVPPAMPAPTAEA